MKEPIPFFGIYETDEEDMEAYLRQQIKLQQMLIDQTQKEVLYWKEMFERVMGMMENKSCEIGRAHV